MSIEKKEELIEDSLGDVDGGDGIVEQFSTTDAVEIVDKHKGYREKHFNTEEKQLVDKLLSDKFPCEVGLGISTSKDMIWDLPVVHANDITREIIYTPKTQTFVYVIVRYTDEEELESEQKVINDNMTSADVSKLIAAIKK